MARLSRRGAVWLLGSMLGLPAVCISRVGAQTPSVDCGAIAVSQPGQSEACSDLARSIAAMLQDPAVAQAHWGIDVTGMDGSPIYSLNEAQLFQPASNAKLFTTAAAMALLGPDRVFETRVVARGTFASPDTLEGDLILVGGGDANLSGRILPYTATAPGASLTYPPPDLPPDPLRYLQEMADQVAATGLKRVEGGVVGDDTLFPYEPYGHDWAIDDAVWGYGAPVSALTVNDNQLKLTVAPGAYPGAQAVVVLSPATSWYSVDAAEMLTAEPKSGSHVQIERAPGSRVLRVYGAIGLDAHPDVEEIAIADPAEYAAQSLKGMLEARGIVVTGAARASHRISTESRGFLEIAHESFAATDSQSGGVQQTNAAGGCTDCPERPAFVQHVVAHHESVPLVEDVTVANKVSQNLHAELMLHQMGLTRGLDGSTAQGARVVRQFLLNAGIGKNDFVFFDGSGLSGHDLVTPRATARLLQYAAGQPWFADWKKSLPVGGVDGSLEGRFAKAPLKGKVFAKTGTLGEARALSGYVECASGKTVIFSIMVGNHLPQTSADREVMDRIVAAIAAAN